MNARTLSETLAEYIAGTRFDALPPEAVAMIRRHHDHRVIEVGPA